MGVLKPGENVNFAVYAEQMRRLRVLVETLAIAPLDELTELHDRLTATGAALVSGKVRPLDGDTLTRLDHDRALIDTAARWQREHVETNRLPA